jgi:hypothetical protein
MMTSNKISWLLAGSVILLAVVQGTAQITIGQDDIPHTLGDTMYYKFSDSLETITIGDTGGPQDWTFDTNFEGNTAPVLVVDKNSTPFGAEFPDANLTWDYMWDDTSHFYFFAQRTASYMTEEGFGFDVPETTFAWPWDVSDTVLVFPLTYGDEWTSHAMKTDTLNPQTWLVTESITFNQADAFGTVTIPMGTYAALRVATIDTQITTTYYLGAPIISDTTVFTSYIWSTWHLGILVGITEEGSFLRDSIFEGDLQIMTSSNIGVEEDGSPVTGPMSLEIFPNPFTDRTDIHFSLEKEGQVTVTLYDASGRRVRDLFDGYAKEFSISWDGRDNSGKALSEGVYFCRIESPKRTNFGRIVLHR